MLRSVFRLTKAFIKKINSDGISALSAHAAFFVIISFKRLSVHTHTRTFFEMGLFMCASHYVTINIIITCMNWQFCCKSLY